MSNVQTALERALPIVATAYGEQFGVQVVLSGTMACTNGKVIMLPMLDEKRGLKEVLLGYLAHESAHIRDTDFDVIKQCQNPIESSMLNLIEDIRIEKLIQEAFPGTLFTLTTMENYIQSQGWTPSPSVEDNPATQLMMYLYHRLYEQVLFRECYKGMTEIGEKIVEQTFPKGFFIRLDGLFGKYMFDLGSTAECLKVARAILKALKDSEDEVRQQENANQDPAKGESSNESSPETGDSNSSEDNQSSDSEQSDPKGSQQAGSLQAESDKQQASGGDSDSSEAQSTAGGENKDKATSLHGSLINETDLPDDVTSLLQDQLRSQASEDNNGDNFKINSYDVGPIAKNEGDVSELQSGILASSVIRSRLQGLLQAQTKIKKRMHIKGKKIKGSRLSRLAQGDSRIFIQRDVRRQIDTAVHVLLDTSGSMSGCQDIANQATVSLALAIQSISKSDIAVSQFPGTDSTAVSPLILRNQGVHPNLGRLNVCSYGGTPLAEAMLFATRELALSRRAKKVLIVITDGAPSNGDSVKYLNSLIDGHVETYAIGIQSTAVKRYFEKWVSIEHISQLQNALFDIADQVFEVD